MSRSKQSPHYKPEWKGPIEGYVVNFITREQWRTAATQERTDLLQEAFLVFSHCAAKYPKMDTPQHFMALFKRSWSNRYHDLATADTRARQFFVPITANKDADGDEMEIREPMGDHETDGPLRIAVRQAPREVLLVLQLMLAAPQELVELALAGWTADSSRRNQGSERINKLLGFPKDYDSIGSVREYFAPASAVLQ